MLKVRVTFFLETNTKEVDLPFLFVDPKDPRHISLSRRDLIFDVASFKVIKV